jgi:hypothetical protein
LASRIDRVEKEFILVTASETSTPARVQALGRMLACRLSSAGKDMVRLSLADGQAVDLKPWESVSVYFDFRGQGFVFETTVRKSAPASIELAYPECMYRGLSRRWPRVAPPQDLSVDIVLPDGGLKLACPVSREYAEVDLPESRGGLKTDSLASLIASFKEKAEGMSNDNRVVMFKEGKGPADFGEELVSSIGRALFIPSILSGLPIADPYDDGRIIVKDEIENFDDELSISRSQKLRLFLESKSREGLSGLLWCPVRYYRYTVGVVYVATRLDANLPFDFRILDFAWDFAALLAWFLKRHGYFDQGKMEAAPRRGAVVDASPTGVLVGLGAGQPRLKTGARLELRMRFGKGEHPCYGRVARRFEKDGRSYYGLAIEGLDDETALLFSKDLYGDKAANIAGLGG